MELNYNNCFSIYFELRQPKGSGAFLMPIRPSSVRRPSSTFSIKSLISQKLSDNFFLFWHVASLGWYQCIVKIWIWLNHPKGHFEMSERSNLAPFLLGGKFSQKLFDNFFSIYARSFPRRVQINCQKMDLI